MDSRQLKYSLRERRWIWDEDGVRLENITDNVLHLITKKMSSFPEGLQLNLKVMSCFGIKVNETIVNGLTKTGCFDFGRWLYMSVREGCMVKVSDEYKFVHDKIRGKE